MLDENTDAQFDLPRAPLRPRDTAVIEQEISRVLNSRTDANKFRVAITPSVTDNCCCRVGVYAIHGGDHFAAAVRCMAMLQHTGLKVVKSPERITEFVTQFTVSK